MVSKPTVLQACGLSWISGPGLRQKLVPCPCGRQVLEAIEAANGNAEFEQRTPGFKTTLQTDAVLFMTRPFKAMFGPFEICCGRGVHATIGGWRQAP